ncbi:glycosyltransferase [Microcoleus sp. AR_TQ3_B6]|uniref:glycosyltransferase n=1 Tax=Microcoleus sp. AR_TQ3_B6 TaxID=3055284 RepID=UPI002FD14D6A
MHGSLIVPAYSEAENIRDGAIAMREITPLSADNLGVLIVDDRSTDDTQAIGPTLQQQPGDPRLKILAGQPRSANQYWAGKNWIGTQAVEVATGDFLLFIHAGVRPGSGAIETAIATAETEKIDLLTCMPALGKRVFCRVVSAADNLQSLSSLLRLYRR